MQHTRRTIGTFIASAGLILTLTACGASSSAPAAPASGSVAAPAASGNLPPAGGPGVMGEISAVDGLTLTVSGQGQQATTVKLTDSTTIARQQTIALADIKAGETVVAVGAQDGDVLTATQIRVGATGAGPGGGDRPAGAPPAGGQPGGPGGQPGGPGAQPGDSVMGSVASVSSDALTVTTQDGASITVKLAGDGQVTTEAEGSAADLAVGTWIMARGDQSDNAVVATQIQIIPAPAAQP